MRVLAFVVFWVGVFRVVREWLYSKKRGAVITLADKLYLVFVLPLLFGVQLVLDLAGVPFEVNVLISGLAMGVALNAWTIKRRIQRNALKHAPPNRVPVPRGPVSN